jgi:hypothetical protein
MERHALHHVLLYETWTQMNVHLDEWFISNALEAMDLACLDHEYVPGACFELLAFDNPEPATLPDELDFIIGMSVWSRAATGECSDEEDRDVNAALVRADKLVGAALKR